MEHNTFENPTTENESFFRNILREYLCRSQVQGYKFITRNDRPLYERILWIMVAISGIFLTFWFVFNSYLAFLESPTVTSEDPIRTSVLDISFPAISICSANRFSRRALMNYSQFILNATKNQDRDHIGRSVDEVFTNLLRMGHMYTLDTDDILEKIHTVLENVYGGEYPIYDILTNMTPTCDSILKKCKWQGRYVNCSEIFSTRRSFMGPCCSFNYQRPWVSILKTQQDFNNTIPTLNEPFKVNSHGADFGLVLLIDQQLDDYALTINSYIGVNILIYDSFDFPDVTSGAVKETIISPEKEVFITLHPNPLEGSSSMRSFTIDSRNCVFDDEINLVFANFYSLSECLLTCRLHSITKFCGCLPPHITNLRNWTKCLFKDLPCLNRWRSDWYYSEPLATNTPIRDIEINDIHCPECVPKCNRVKRSIEMSEADFDPSETKKKSLNPEFINISDVSNHSIVYINFGTNKVTSYDQTAQYLWYELLANLGGVGCLSLGATMVSIIEAVYFFSGKLGALWTTEKLKNVRANSPDRQSQFDYVD